MPLSAPVGVYASGNRQLVPPLIPLQPNELSVLLQPPGNEVRLVVSSSAVAGRASSVANLFEELLPGRKLRERLQVYVAIRGRGFGQPHHEMKLAGAAAARQRV